MNAWEQILLALHDKTDVKTLDTWLRPARFSLLHEGVLYVRVPNPTFKDWIEANYLPMILAAAEQLAGVRSVEFVADRSMTQMPEEQQAVAVGGASGSLSAGGSRPASGGLNGATNSARAPDISAPLNPRLTFATFVVGASNQFAHAAAIRVATDPVRSYNPLFLYGGSGLGKTHLMHAIAHALRERHPDWKIVYVPAERFTNEMVQSIKDDRMVGFHQRYRSVDTLLVDDIQFLAGKERTQEEFFHTFNTLMEMQRQIVISSDRPPKEIAQIEERLRSRFEQGLNADIQPPDLETRQAILIKKAEADKFSLPEKVALFIASHIKSNIRELEGSLVRLMAFASFAGEEISEAMARQVLKDMIDTDSKRVSIELIQKTVCEHYGLRLQELKAKDNSKRVVVPRQVAMWLARELTHASFPEIARAFGDKHHTTVLHSIEKVSRQRADDRDLNRTLNKLLASLE